MSKLAWVKVVLCGSASAMLHVQTFIAPASVGDLRCENCHLALLFHAPADITPHHLGNARIRRPLQLNPFWSQTLSLQICDREKKRTETAIKSGVFRAAEFK